MCDTVGINISGIINRPTLKTLKLMIRIMTGNRNTTVTLKNRATTDAPRWTEWKHSMEPL